MSRAGSVVADRAFPMTTSVRFISSGIPEREFPSSAQREIFEPFQSTWRRNSPRKKAAAIGLTISRRLVQAMDGKIGFESFVGQGSKFWVELPMAQRDCRGEDGSSTVAVSRRAADHKMQDSLH